MKTIKKVIPVILIAIMLCTGCGNTPTQEPQELEKQETVQEKPKKVTRDAKFYNEHFNRISEVFIVSQFYSCALYVDGNNVHAVGYATITNKSDDIIVKDLEITKTIYNTDGSILVRLNTITSYLMPNDSTVICEEFDVPIENVKNPANLTEEQKIEKVSFEDLTSENQYPKISDFSIEHQTIKQNILGGYDILGDITCSYNGPAEVTGPLYMTVVVYEGREIKMVGCYPIDCSPGQSTSFEIPNMTCPKHEGEFTSIEFYPSYLTL